jgi:hypothetical protein
MHFINSSSLAPDVSDWLATSRHPRILQVFEHACNLINERGEVLSIVTTQIGNGPFNLVVEEDICFSEHLGLESVISASPTQLHLGDLSVDIVNASIWNSRPDWGKLHAGKGDIGRQLSQLRMTNYSRRGIEMGFAAVRSDSTTADVQALVSNLSSAFAVADLPSSLLAVRKLAGLGAGLTPAGDDYLMGAIYAVWIAHPFDVAGVLAKNIADTAAPLTTSLSAAWLKAAGKGEAGILWHEFFDALLSKDWARIEESKKKILAVGATSGADALAGFTGVFASWMEKAGFSYG